MAVAALKNVAQTAIQSGQSLYVGFLDLVKAYDSVYRTALFGILRQYGFGDNTLRLLRNYYLDQNFVRVNGKLGAPFQSGRGVRQGCLLSPLLFDIVLVWVFRRAKDQLTPICHGTISLWGLAYADDIALVAYTPDVLQRNLNVLQEHLQKVGLKISPAKTKAMCVRPALHVVGDSVQGASSRNQKYASRVAGAGDAVRGTYSFENDQKYILWPPDCSAMIVQRTSVTLLRLRCTICTIIYFVSTSRASVFALRDIVVTSNPRWGVNVCVLSASRCMIPYPGMSVPFGRRFSRLWNRYCVRLHYPLSMTGSVLIVDVSSAIV